MATIKVTNKSPRLFTNIGGKSLVPEQSIEIDAEFKADLMHEGKPLEGLEIEEVQEEGDATKAAKKGAWSKND